MSLDAPPSASGTPAAPPESPRRARTFLGRLAQAVREQSWFAVALEVCIVVLGVVIGFQVNAWGNERATRAQERELLRGLRSEFVANLALYDRTAARHRYVRERALEFLQLIGPEPVLDDTARIDTLIVTMTGEIPMYHPAMGEVEAMLGAGQLGIVRDDSLRTALASWPGILDLLQEVEQEHRGDVLNHLWPYIVGKTPLGAVNGTNRFPRRHDVLLSDIAFENHVGNRGAMVDEILEVGVPVRALLVQMIGQIDRQLGVPPHDSEVF